MGEIFAIVPYTAFFDSITGSLKSALADPFTAIGLIPGAVCWATCEGKFQFANSYEICNGHRIIKKLGLIVSQVKGVIDSGGFAERQDYCTKLEGKNKDDK